MPAREEENAQSDHDEDEYEEEEPQIGEVFRVKGINAEFTKVSVAPPLNWRRQFVVVVGSQFSGKTHWMQHLFSEIFSQFHYGIAFNSTADIHDEYGWMPRDNVYDTWDDELDEDGVVMVVGFKNAMNTVFNEQIRNI